MFSAKRRSHSPVDGGSLQGASHPAGLVRLSLLLGGSGWALREFTGPPDLSQLPALPSWNTLEVLLRSPSAPIDGVLRLGIAAAWLVWFWATGSLLIELALGLLENGPARGAAWLQVTRAVACRITMPLARRAVAAAIVVHVVTRTAAPAFAAAQASPASGWIAPATFTPYQGGLVVAPRGAVEFQPLNPSAPATLTSQSTDLVMYTVQPGDTLWGIAERYYGSGEDFERLIDANDGKLMPDGRVFDRAGLIFPGWVLDIPQPNTIVEQDGHTYYIVHRGDTLCGIAAGLLGDEHHYREIFDLNVGTARVGDDGPVLAHPNLIWPGLRLRLPDDVSANPPPADEPEPVEPREQVPAVDQSVSSSVGDHPESTVTATVLPVQIVTSVSAEPIATLALPTVEPSSPPTPHLSRQAAPLPAAGPQVPMPFALPGGAIVVAGLAGAAALVVTRRRPAPLLTEPESDAVIDDGFAEIDPSRTLAGGAPNPAAIVARKLSRAYAKEFMAMPPPSNAAEMMAGISLVSTRHGRSSMTLTIAAPPTARAHLIQHLEAVVASAFGDDVDTEALVSHDGDVLVRLTGVDRYVTRGRLLELVGPEGTDAEVWPPPFLVRLGLLNDRHTLAANWDALGNVLVTALVGQGAEAVMTALVTSLASERAPSDLGLVTIAAPRSLPVELERLPHQLIAVVDPARGPDGLAAIQDVGAELSRRVAAAATSEPDLVVVIRELADLDGEQMAALGRVAADGPQYRVRLLAASERPAVELVQRCGLLNYFSTRLVQHAVDEDESVALLGTPGAEELSSAGQVLLRRDGRTPVQANAFRVPPQHLTRLLKLMGERRDPSEAQDAHVEPKSEPSSEPTSDGPGEEATREEETAPEVIPDVAIEPVENVEDGAIPPPLSLAETERLDSTVPEVARSAPTELPRTPDDAIYAVIEPVERSNESRLLQQLRHAPMRVQCFGGRGVWHGEVLLWPRPGVVEETGWELLLILAIHPVAGVQAETLVDIIWPDKPPERPSASLRKRRWRLRQELKQLLPTFEGDPLPTDPNGLVYSLDPAVIASDVHLFLELVAHAKSLPREQAIVAYEEALGLYQGDLLDSPDVPTYWWLYNGHALATTLRSDYRRQEHEVRLLLAELCGAGASAAELMHAQELSAGLTAEDPEDERLWTALFSIHGRRGDSLGLEAAARRLRRALVELGKGDDPDNVIVPPTLERVLKETRATVGKQSSSAVA